MAYYAVGDIQGCYQPLMALLEQVDFNPDKDTLFCVGDLVNRGPESLQVLRFLKGLGSSCITVLGNHDLHLLSMYYGIRTPKKGDTMQQVLEAEDAHELCLWLRQQPVLHINEKRRFILCHAGIYPWWTRQQAQEYADSLHKVLLNEKKCQKLLKKMYGNRAERWQDCKSKHSQRRFIVNAFTRMRFCSPKGYLQLTQSGYKGTIRKNRQPWFKISVQDNEQSLKDYRIIFGHWSALGLYNKKRFLCLDTGYVWGNKMTLAKIPSKPQANVTLFQTPFK